MLLDEVSAGLAPLVVSRLFEAARSAAKNDSVGILLVEQQIRRAVSVADRIYVLNDGHITFAGTRAELRERPELIEESFFLRRRGEPEQR
jgi:branched-chain amino acid transport system ATP-binding protein